MTPTWRGAGFGGLSAAVVAVLLVVPFLLLLLFSGVIYPVPMDGPQPPYLPTFAGLWIVYLLVTGVGGGYIGGRIASRRLQKA
jgi:hypothetical protein